MIYNVSIPSSCLVSLETWGPAHTMYSTVRGARLARYPGPMRNDSSQTSIFGFLHGPGIHDGVTDCSDHWQYVVVHFSIEEGWLRPAVLSWGGFLKIFENVFRKHTSQWVWATGFLSEAGILLT